MRDDPTREPAKTNECCKMYDQSTRRQVIVSITGSLECNAFHYIRLRDDVIYKQRKF